MKPVDVLVLNNIGGGFDILVKRLPNPHETIMMKQMRLTEDLPRAAMWPWPLRAWVFHAPSLAKLGTTRPESETLAGCRPPGWTPAKCL